MFEFYAGITAAIVACLVLVWRFRTEGKKLYEKAKRTIRDKMSIVDNNYMAVSEELIGEAMFVVMKETDSSVVSIGQTERIRRIRDVSRIEEEMKLTEEERKAISDKISVKFDRQYRQRLLRISRVAALMEAFPGKAADIIDNTTKALIAGFAGAILVLVYGYEQINGFGLTEPMISLIGVAALLAVSLYSYAGIYQVWPLWQLEKQVEKIQGCERMDELEEHLKQYMSEERPSIYP